MCSQGKETSGGFGRDSGVTPLMLAPREEAEDRRTLGRFNGVRAGSTYASEARLFQVAGAAYRRVPALVEFCFLNQNTDI